MNISSRTPEGEFNHCPVCGKFIVLAPSKPTGDAPCPHCGVLLWFAQLDDGLFFRPKSEVGLGSAATSGGVSPSGARRLQSERFHVGDPVRIKAGAFESFEGEVSRAEEATAKIEVVIEIFGRKTSVDVETWQIEPA